ncbi:hypothetical protein SAMN05443144_111104 [Fodinibius roseus]|uniref:Type II secretory pathway, pseudopilin PulG n=1 Tax=Fodinibius roseus TaxID=1194090 RepID=A0A1M5DFS0_9BACT|nr:hypothetical protein [Fodinibius roseus]SHF65888.1 hypothetical protein SAMN05443144_111104 [Fodinibius roseus]
MGQQQLLLVILVTIIVGVATVTAINIFGASAENSAIDATRQDILTMGAQMQGYALKPELMGGGGGDFTGLTVDKLGFGYTEKTSDTAFENGNAAYSLTVAADGSSVEITATPHRLADATTWSPKAFTVTVLKDDISVDTEPAKATASAS